MNRSIIAFCSFAVATSAVVMAHTTPKSAVQPTAKIHFRRDSIRQVPPESGVGSVSKINGGKSLNAVSPTHPANPFARPSGSVNIRVFVHVLTSSDTTRGQVSDDQINTQINLMNLAFSGRKTIPDGSQPLGSSADTPFRFTKVSTDRTPNDGWFHMAVDGPDELAAKQALYHGTSRDLNLYICEPVDNDGTPLEGFASYPWEYNKNRIKDAVVIDHRSMMGDSDTSYAPFNQGMTAVRSTGHWLGLYSTFYPANEIGFTTGCDLKNDQVSDTPAEASPNFGDWYDPIPPSTTRPAIRDTCIGRNFPGADPVENFMDYTQDPFMYRFTNGQSVRMDFCATTYRYITGTNK